MRALALAAALLLCLPHDSMAWGFTAHRLINRKAIATLPAPLRALFDGNAGYLAEHAIDPDLWRGSGALPELPNHFLDMDAFGAYPFQAIAHDEAGHVTRFGADAAEKGRVPWRIEEVYRELVAAFRSGDPARVLERAAVLGHYVGDAHVPLHAALNHDGQLSGQLGIHSRWESELVERYQRQLEPAVRPARARQVADPVALAFGALRQSFLDSGELLASDRACAGDLDVAGTREDERYGDSYYTRMYEREQGRLVSRMTAAATAIGSLWLTAWHEAGRPPLPAGFRFPYVRRATQAILVSLDGSPAPVLDDAVARGVMPQLARLRAAGATARGSMTSYPAKTAAGHAALYTGALPNRNGITGNEVALPGASVLETNSGYSSTHLLAEPLWVTAARQGLAVTVATGTQVHPFTPFLSERRFGSSYDRSLMLFDGYRSFEWPEAVYRAKDLEQRPAEGWNGVPSHAGEPKEITLSVAGTRVDGLFYDDPADPAAGFDSLCLALDKDCKGGVILKPEPSHDADAAAFGGLQLRAGGGDSTVFFRLFALAPDGSDLLLFRSTAQVLQASRPALEAEAYRATGGFAGNGAKDLYARGALGPPLWAGGDGTAERRYLETVALTARQFTRLNRFCLDRTRWDLLLAYLPYPDEALHMWLGYLDPALSRHDPELAARLRPFLDRLLRIVDDYVGSLAEAAAARGAILAVCSDHGMMAADSVFLPNVVLERAGLLGRDARGGVDLAHTRAVYFPGNSGFVLINRTSRPGGIVRPDEEDAVTAAVTQALEGYRDPATGKPVVLGVVDVRRDATVHGLGGATGGDLYLRVERGYYPVPGLKGDPVQAQQPRGVHMLDPDRPEMLAAFAVAGPGVAQGADLGQIRNIDVAPTLCALLGIDPPAQASGVVLTKALARPLPPARGR